MEAILPPVADDVSRPFWEAVAAEELRLQWCGPCQRFWHFPVAVCPSCLGTDTFEWRAVSGRGRVESFIVVHRSRVPGFQGRTPYAVLSVELVEQPGLRMFANLSGDGPERIEVGAAVEVVFERSGEVVLPQFRLTHEEYTA